MYVYIHTDLILIPHSKMTLRRWLKRTVTYTHTHTHTHMQIHTCNMCVFVCVCVCKLLPWHKHTYKWRRIHAYVFILWDRSQSWRPICRPWRPMCQPGRPTCQPWRPTCQPWRPMRGHTDFLSMTYMHIRMQYIHTLKHIHTNTSARRSLFSCSLLYPSNSSFNLFLKVWTTTLFQLLVRIIPMWWAGMCIVCTYIHVCIIYAYINSYTYRYMNVFKYVYIPTWLAGMCLCVCVYVCIIHVYVCITYA